MLVLCGKTASGKDTVLKELIKLGMKKIVTYTTRPMRNGEVDGESYYFINEEEFLFMKDNEFFLETTSYKVATGETWHYGTPKNQIGNDKVIILNPDGVKFIKSHMEYNPIIMYLNVDENILLERLKERGDNLTEAGRRLEADDKDFLNLDLFWDFGIRNQNIEIKTLAKTIYGLYQMKVS